MDTRNIILDIYPTIRPVLELFDHEDVSGLTPDEFLTWCLSRYKESRPDERFVIYKNEQGSYQFRVETNYGEGGVHIPFGTLYENFSPKNKKLLIEVAALCRRNFQYWFESYLYEMEREQLQTILTDEPGELEEDIAKNLKQLLFDYTRGKIFGIEKQICHTTTLKKVINLRRKCKANSSKTKLELRFIDQMISIHRKDLSVRDGCTKQLGIPDDEEAQLGPTDTFVFIWKYNDHVHESIEQTLNDTAGNCGIASPMQYTLPDEEPTKLQFYHEFDKLYSICAQWNKS